MFAMHLNVAAISYFRDSHSRTYENAIFHKFFATYSSLCYCHNYTIISCCLDRMNFSKFLLVVATKTEYKSTHDPPILCRHFRQDNYLNERNVLDSLYVYHK